MESKGLGDKNNDSKNVLMDSSWDVHMRRID